MRGRCGISRVGRTHAITLSRALAAIAWMALLAEQIKGRHMSLQETYENKTGENATYTKDGATYHTLRYVYWLESRLAEEIKWGHRNCEPDDCKSSGTDCPANPSRQDQAARKEP